MSEYFDDLGLIGHKRPDFPSFDVGDSCREFGTYATGCAIKRELNMPIGPEWPFSGEWECRQNVKKYMPEETGVYVRHPKSVDTWHMEPRHFSRDQWEGLMCGLIMTNQFQRIKELREKQKEHPFTAQNGDLITWEWNLYLRGAREGWFLLLFLDLGLVVNSIVRVIDGWFSGEVKDDINHTTMLAVAYFKMPTPASWLAHQIYRLRPINQAWKQYHNPTNFPDEAPPLDVFWEQIIVSLFG